LTINFILSSVSEQAFLYTKKQSLPDCATDHMKVAKPKQPKVQAAKRHEIH